MLSTGLTLDKNTTRSNWMHALRRATYHIPHTISCASPIAPACIMTHQRHSSTETPAKKLKMTGPLIGTHK